MPQNPVLVYLRKKPARQPICTRSMPPKPCAWAITRPCRRANRRTPEARASAMSRFKTGQAGTHPELQTDEEKAEARRKANEEAAVFAGSRQARRLWSRHPVSARSQAARQAGVLGVPAPGGSSAAAAPAQERTPRRESSS